MIECKKLYFHMFISATDAIAAIERGNIGEAEQLLKSAQLLCEELFIEPPPKGDDGQTELNV